MCQTPLRYWISGPSPSSFAALLDRSSDNVYTPYVRNSSEVLHLWYSSSPTWFDYMTLRSASVVFIDNDCAGTYFLLSVFKGMNSIIALLPYNYI
jgi:hypothetical protein